MKKKSETLVIADFGCGEARLARALSSSCRKIYSFDLVALNEEVTVCDFSRTPLNNESVDIAVFCLSLMGTHIRYVKLVKSRYRHGGPPAPPPILCPNLYTIYHWLHDVYKYYLLQRLSE